MKRKSFESELNSAQTSIADFIEAYNKTIPPSFPRASAAALQQFQISHPILFKKGTGWSVDKHRKRLMDWLSSYQMHES